MKFVQHKFNLLELIICLGILAVLASILLENFADVKARECEAQTRERGNHIRSMMTGQNSTENISAFLSDMGRFPMTYIPSDGDGSGGRRLAELYDPSIWHHSSSGTALQQLKTISAAEIRDICQKPSGSTFPADSSGVLLPYPEISMTVGWNGPYINIANPVNGNFFDGWGNAWKIVSDYHYTVSNNKLIPNRTVYAAESELAGTPRRIDGIISFGANDADDSTGSNVSPADVDAEFIFAHNMDNHSSENLADLRIELKLRDTSNGQWRNVPEIVFWKSNTVYSRGAIIAVNGNIYCCHTAHTSPASFSADYWHKLSEAAAYDPSVHGLADYSGITVYQNSYHLRISNAPETEFTAGNWLRIAGVGEIPDNISLMIFAPVMQQYDGNRIMQLGYYHFFRNSSGENAHGVKPLYGASSPSEDVDCTGDTNTVYSAGSDYNARYLIAEDHSASNWSEFYIKRLIPGRRRIFCIIYNSFTKSCYQSPVEVLVVKRGNNFVTLYLERKL